jgi:hypothetical protein
LDLMDTLDRWQYPAEAQVKQASSVAHLAHTRRSAARGSLHNLNEAIFPP